MAKINEPETAPAITVNGFATRVVTLPRSKIKVHIPEDFHVADTSAAQRYGKGDMVKVNLSLFQRTCRFNGGEVWRIDQISEAIKGRDWLFLCNEFYDDGSDDEAGDEVGNA
ncbi:hypothetical protein V5G24_00240 [Xanthobacter sp. VTT E-85241]|uniref:hypothetical protein n=1 Tax=Roseixanthobacter finlandensis TaxID=3119922 RepID=UPI00372A530C